VSCRFSLDPREGYIQKARALAQEADHFAEYHRMRGKEMQGQQAFPGRGWERIAFARPRQAPTRVCVAGA